MKAEVENQNHKGFLRGALVVFFFNILQKILAFGQQILFARLMGLSAQADAFALAQILPNLIGGLVALSASTAVVSCVGVSDLGDRSVRSGLAGSFIWFLCACLAGALGCFFWSPALPEMIDPGKTGPVRALTVGVLRTMSPLLLLLPTSGILSGLQQAERRFFWPSLSWILPTAGSLAGAAWYPSAGVEALAVGWVSGAAGQVVLLLVTMPASWRIRPTWSGSLFASYLTRLVSIIGVAASTTLYLVVDRFSASRLSPGLPAAFALAGTLITVPSQLVSFSVNSSLLPALMPLVSQPGRFARLWLDSSFVAAALVMPAMLLFTLAPAPLLALVFQSRNFGEAAVRMTAVTLASYGPAMLGLLMRDCCVPALLALRCEREIIAVSGIGFAANLAIKGALTSRGNPALIAGASGFGLIVCGAGLMFVLAKRMAYPGAVDLSSGWALGRAVIGASAVSAVAAIALKYWFAAIAAKSGILVMIPAVYGFTLILAYPPLLGLLRTGQRAVP
jgi:putative peptidoglycan lipid II flippase